MSQWITPSPIFHTKSSSYFIEWHKEAGTKDSSLPTLHNTTFSLSVSCRSCRFLPFSFPALPFFLALGLAFRVCPSSSAICFRYFSMLLPLIFPFFRLTLFLLRWNMMTSDEIYSITSCKLIICQIYSYIFAPTIMVINSKKQSYGKEKWKGRSP